MAREEEWMDAETVANDGPVVELARTMSGLKRVGSFLAGKGSSRIGG